MTQEEITAEITTALKQYEESGLVDPISIDQWIRNAMREFGGNFMIGSDYYIKIENSKGDLPLNFYSLVNAIKCDEKAYSATQEGKKHLQSSLFYKERLEQITYFTNDTNTPIIEGEDCKLIKEDIYFEDKSPKATIWYGNFQPLKLIKHYKKVPCETGCPNLRLACTNEFSINGTKVHTNFEKGTIYINYKGFPEDETGGLIIPEIQRNKLIDYIKYTCIRRTLEAIFLSGDDGNVQQKLQYFRQLENENYLLAKNDSFAEGSKGWEKLIKSQNRYHNNLKYESMIPKI